MDDCGGNTSRLSCEIVGEEVSKRDAIASIRILVAVLSIVGSLSIIISVLVRKQLSTPKIHPIFVLSVADGMLSVTWIIGGLFWFTTIDNRAWCFLPSLLTVVLECVTVNLTLVYAVFAYSSIKNRNLIQDLATTTDRGGPELVRRPWVSRCVYCLAWLLPVLLFAIAFAPLAGFYKIMGRANTCSCWCLPYFGNVLPMAFPRDNDSADYVWDIRKLVASYGVLIGTNYLLVFILLLVIYYKVLRYIKTLRQQHEQLRRWHPNYGAVDTLILKSESKARKRVVAFLTVFLITGCFNFVLSYLFAIFEGVQLHSKPHITATVHDHLPAQQLVLYLLQSVTVPMQGFLNAIVYGWTREDFLAVVVRSPLVQAPGKLRGDGKQLEHSSSLQLSQDRNVFSESSGLLKS